MQGPPEARKRQRTTIPPNVDCAITINMDRERVLLRETEELKTWENLATLNDLRDLPTFSESKAIRQNIR